MNVSINTKASKYFLGAGWQVILCCVQHNLFERPFGQQLKGGFPHLIEISDEISYIVAVTPFLRKTPRPVLASILYSSFEKYLRITRQKNLDWI